MTARRPRPLLLAACGALAWLVGWSGTCTWSAGTSTHDCTEYCARYCGDPLAHDVHSCNCDCTGAADEDLEIGAWAAIVDGEPGRHPFEQVLGVDGVAAPSEALLDFAALHAWGSDVLRANPDLFALPEWAGILVPLDVAAGAEGWTLSWVQVRSDGSAVPDGIVELVVDWGGRLVRTTNRTRLTG